MSLRSVDARFVAPFLGLILGVGPGCGGGTASLGPAGPVVVTHWLEGTPPRDLLVQIDAAEGCNAQLKAPDIVGLTLGPGRSPDAEAVGTRLVTRTRWALSGPKGSYVVEPLRVPWRCGEATGEAVAPALFFDLGDAVAPPEGFGDIDDPGRRWENYLPSWPMVVFIAAVSAVASWGTTWLLRRPRGAPVAAPRVPPDVRVLRAWDAVRADPKLSNDEKAMQLSRLFREYAEEVLAFPATSWTTSETLAKLGALKHLPEGNLTRARRLLRATDLVKYAEVPVEGDMFDELDADIRAFIESTRPTFGGAP